MNACAYHAALTVSELLLWLMLNRQSFLLLLTQHHYQILMTTKGHYFMKSYHPQNHQLIKLFSNSYRAKINVHGKVVVVRQDS